MKRLHEQGIKDSTEVVASRLSDPSAKARRQRITEFCAMALAGSVAAAFFGYVLHSKSAGYEDFRDRDAIVRALDVDGFSPDPQEIQWRYDKVVTRQGNVAQDSTEFSVLTGECSIPVTADFTISGADDQASIDFTNYRFSSVEGIGIDFTSAEDLRQKLGDEPCAAIIKGEPQLDTPHN